MPQTTPSTAGHVRDHRSLLARVEKRALIWIAERLPQRISSDHLSAIGLGSMVLAGISLASMRIVPSAAWPALGVVICLAANWFGDSLDGTVARVRSQQRPRYGYYVDHVIDLIGTTALLTGLALSGLMNPLMAAAVAAAYLLVCAEAYLATHAGGVFRMSIADSSRRRRAEGGSRTGDSSPDARPDSALRCRRRRCDRRTAHRLCDDGIAHHPGTSCG
jgi:archaetidylinositol phosphate synthase